jgi:CDP-4-dehydro-6-deoxyglucose reductase
MSEIFQIQLKDNVVFKCSSEDTLLDGALKENKTLNYSCKSGRCNSCKAKVIHGETIAIGDEIGLTPTELNDGYILTCFRKPISDISLDMEDVGTYGIQPVKTFPAKIDSISKLTESVIELKLRIPPQTNFQYLPGQYVNIIKDDYKRSYSIAANNAHDGIILYIKNYEGGRFSNYLFNEAKLNDLLRVEAPLGTFFLRNSKVKNLVFLATGTGIAPVKAILENLDNLGPDKVKKNIFLFFGGRTKEDIFWTPKFENLAIEFISVISTDSEGWTGKKGYVQDVLLSEDIDLVESQVYACGSSNMVHQAKEKLIQHGLPIDSFFADEFIRSY